MLTEAFLTGVTGQILFCVVYVFYVCLCSYAIDCIFYSAPTVVCIEDVYILYVVKIALYVGKK